MLIKLYIFSMVLGAFLLGASILLGDTEIDADVDVDLDADIDLDLDADASGEVGFGGADFFLWTFKSVRFWTFFVAFFGLTGLALDGLDILPSLVALPVAGAVGMAIGATAHGIVRALSKNELGSVAKSTDYVGKTARILLPIESGRAGKVRIDLKGTTVDVLATSDEHLRPGDGAIIIEMQGTTARVAGLNKVKDGH